jgi:probable phosphoglycerate mutase
MSDAIPAQLQLPRPACFGILRHARTTWNEQRRIQGRGNSPLTPGGIAAATAWANHLADDGRVWHRIVTSPLPRARETAAILGRRLDLPIQTVNGLQEQDWGLWEGLQLQEIKQSFPGELERGMQDGWEFRPPRGESRREVCRRVTATLRAIGSRWSGENLLVVTHLGVIKALVYSIAGRNYLPQEPDMLQPDHLHTVILTGETFRLLPGTLLPPGPSCR